MLAPATPAAERALAGAALWAARQGTHAVAPVHLLLALLEEEEGRAVELLAIGKLAREEVFRTFAAAAAAAVPPGVGELPWSAAGRSCLDRARELAADASADRTFSTTHLLQALLQQDDELGATLRRLGLDLGALEAHLQEEQTPPLTLEEPLRLTESGEATDLARILDVAANRAREALRVLEDYVRFSLDDAVLSRAAKQLRHDLAAALEAIPLRSLLAARDTRHDVGTTITTEREQQRFSVVEVVQANSKRLQESLRSLEEYGKLHGGDLGRALEALRYRAYTLERAMLLGAGARQRLADVRLCVLATGSACAASLRWTLEEAMAGGADMIQLREKALADRDLLDRARQVRAWTRKGNALFIMNDRPDIARLVEADGVHLGQNDLPVKEARRIVGPHALIGVSTHDLGQLEQAILDGASYVGVGPTFASATKHFDDLKGVEYVRQACAATTLPAFAIGGINLDTVVQAVAAGARRVAVSQAICQADDPRTAAAALRAAALAG